LWDFQFTFDGIAGSTSTYREPGSASPILSPALANAGNLVAVIHINTTSDHKTRTAAGAKIGICSISTPFKYSITRVNHRMC